MYVRTLHSTSWLLSTMAPSNTPARPSPCACPPPGRTEDRYTSHTTRRANAASRAAARPVIKLRYSRPSF